MHVPHFIHSSTDGLWGCLNLLATVSNGTMHMCVQGGIRTPVFISFGYIPRKVVRAERAWRGGQRIPRNADCLDGAL